MRIPSREPSTRKPLRLWPGAVAVALQWLVRFVTPVVAPSVAVLGVIGGVVGGAVVLIWWLFFSRAPWMDRIGAIALMVGAVAMGYSVVDPSIANGMMGMMLPLFSIPFLCMGLVASAAATRGLAPGRRRAVMAAAIVLAGGVMALVRTGGVNGDGTSDIHWRWTTSPEERLLAQAADEPVPTPRKEPVETPPATVPDPVKTPTSEPAAAKSSEPATDPLRAKTSDKPIPARAAAWPGFRGPNRDGIARGVRIDTDWARNPPVRLWQRPIGPGWSSFAVSGDLIYTQEQRGEHEVVSCYRLTTGEPVWRHRDAVRFWESNGGAGPRGTPTLHDGRVYTVGATGLVNALDAGTGAVVWSQNAARDNDRQVPIWGFASSPLIVGDLVVVALSGQLIAFDIGTGKQRWVGPTGGGGGYSSPHLATFHGVRQIVLLRGGGAAGVSPADGSLLWDHSWESGTSIVQPALVGDGEMLITAGDNMGGIGVRRLAVAPGAPGSRWTVEERWTSRGLKPYFNDLVVHKGHAVGFDGSILSCIDIQDGQRKWKGGRFGHGQLLLLPDQDLLLVLSEEGELALVGAAPDQFTEIARVPGIEGKTWNHPVLVGDVLLVRNGEQMAAFKLARLP